MDLESLGMISNWLFYFQRNDANLRNEWSNYTNWPYNYIPINVSAASTTGTYKIHFDANSNDISIGPGVNPDGTNTGLVISPDYNPQNEKNILVAMGVLLDGSYRENIQPAGVFDYIEKT